MIIQSLLDTDLYKFTMMQVVLHQYPAAEVEYRFRCRTPGVDLVPLITRIREELDHLCSLRFGDDELAYLRTLLGPVCADEEDLEARCLIAFSVAIADRLIAADHGARTRSDVRKAVRRQLFTPAEGSPVVLADRFDGRSRRTTRGHERPV